VYHPLGGVTAEASGIAGSNAATSRRADSPVPATTRDSAARRALGRAALAAEEGDGARDCAIAMAGRWELEWVRASSSVLLLLGWCLVMNEDSG
jgi:hypothetical protein